MHPELPSGWPLFDRTPSPLGVATCDGRLLRANLALGRLVGRPPDALAGLDLLARLGPERARDLREEAGRLCAGGREELSAIEQVPRDAGGPRWLRADVQAVHVPGGEPLLLLAVSDVTPASERGDGLQAERDPVTGLPAAGRLEGELERTLAEVRRHDRAASLVLLGLDDLEAWTSAHGPQAADRLLRFTAAATSGRIRTEDLAARVAGDVVAVLLRDAGPADAARVAEELAALVTAHGVAEGRPVGATTAVLSLDERLDGGVAALHAGRLALAAARHRGRAAQADGSSGAVGLLDGLQAAALVPSVPGMLRAVRELLGMDVAYVTEHTPSEQVLLELEGDGSTFGVEAGTRLPLEATYCQRILAGDLPALLPDVPAHPVAGAMPVTTAAQVGAFVSVPVLLADGTFHGTLCAASHDVRPALADRDLQFLRVLSRLVASELERDQTQREQLFLRTQAAGADALLSAMEARDRYTGAHSREVVELAQAVGRRLGLQGAELHDVAQVALLHDIGKLSVPDAILGKPGPLEGEELAIMRRHPGDGARIVEAIPELRHLAPAIRAEHERWDGDGYPDGLAQDAIPLASRIVFVCDAFHAMVTDRPYRRRMAHAEAVQELADHAGTQFCPRCVPALLAVLAGT